MCGDSNSGGGGDNNECDYEDGSVVRSSVQSMVVQFTRLGHFRSVDTVYMLIIIVITTRKWLFFLVFPISGFCFGARILLNTTIIYCPHIVDTAAIRLETILLNCK